MENDLQTSLSEDKEVMDEKSEEKNNEIVSESETVTEEITSLEEVNVTTDEAIHSEEKNVVLASEQVKMEESNKKNVMNNLKNKKGIIIGGVSLLVILLLVLGSYFLIFNNPTRVYKKMIEKSMDKLSSFVLKDNSKKNITISTDLDLNVIFAAINKNVIDLVNDSQVKLNYQFDKANKKLFIDLDLAYDNEKVLNSKLLMDNNANKIYAYEESFYDKYLSDELNSNSFYVALYNLLGEASSKLDEQVDLEKLQEVLVNELTKIIKSEDCYKENDFFIYEIKISELMERMEDILNDLANDKDFLDCFEDSTYMSDVLSEMAYNMNEYSIDDTIKISTSLNGSKLEKMIISLSTYELVLDVYEDSVDYRLLSNGQSFLNGYIKNAVEGNTKKIELSLNVPMFVQFKLNVDVTDNGNPNIEVVDLANVKLADELTEEEVDQILDNIKKSKLYRIFTELEDDFFPSIGADSETDSDNSLDNNLDEDFSSIFEENFNDNFDFNF